MTNNTSADQVGLRCVGVSNAAQNVSKAIAKVAPFGSTVLISGPSGTGKELIAREIHEKSPRAGRLFVPVDCASMTGELMASQLFGHLKGAFTSAEQGSLGCFRAAEGGTIFLDEIGELPLTLQSKLLRVIQERAVVPVGGHEAIPVNVRIVAATNRDLREEVAAGHFRSDLFYRISVVTIQTRPLVDRSEDIPVLSEYFLRELEQHGHPRHQLAPGALELLELYDWPGNVRELKNVLEQAALDADDYWITGEIMLRVLAPALHGRRPLRGSTLSRVDELEALGVTSTARMSRSERLDGQWPRLEDEERRLIVETLEHTFYNKSAAARLLAISRQALIRKMIKLGIPAQQTT